MTNTIHDDRQVDRGQAATAPVPAPPPKLRRRPALVAGAVAAICLGALLGAWTWTSTTDTQEVLAARTTIPRGAVIGAEDVARVRVNGDPALDPIPASSYDDIVGQRAALDIASGTLLTAEATSPQLLPPQGASVVGVALAPSQAPGVPLQSGDRVRVVATPAEGSDAPAGAPTYNEAEVVGSQVDDVTGELVIDLLVPHSEATVLAARVATGNVAVILDSGER